MSANPVVHMTPEEYLEAERKAEFKSEYYGEIYAMAGGSYPHGVIIGNLCRELGTVLKGKGCTVTPNDVRLQVSPEGMYSYPDVMVVCGEPTFADDQKDTVLNPTVIIEVISKSTEAHDRGLKLTLYRGLDSLQEYLLVSQYEPRIERIARNSSGQWLLTDCVGIDAVCRLESLRCDISMREIYDNVKFTKEQGVVRRL